jgi:hypothetical protein
MAKRILVSGAISRLPLGGAGNTWAFLQYILGLRRLGFETYYVEFLDPKARIEEVGDSGDFSSCANARYFRAVMNRFALSDSMALVDLHGSGHIGCLSLADINQLLPDVDLLINISGQFSLKSWLGKARRRMYLDLDPGYSQIWQAQYGVDMNLPGHDVYVTVGLNLGKSSCPLPTCDLQWQATLPPVVLSEWTTQTPPGATYTTVADWRGYGAVEWQGVWYQQKADEFLRVIEIPRRVSVPLEICLSIHPDELDRITLEEHGWHLVSPRRHSATPDTYRDYIFNSRGEFTAVKHGYAAGRTGWFSDRSACYLAAGRPVICQDTGIGEEVPTGAGFLTFSDLDSAVDAISRVEQDYAQHAAAAAAFAREYLDSDRVLTRLLQLAGV